MTDILMHGLDADLDNLQQYVGWWAQEKYRGVRLYWDGAKAWSRQVREIMLPADWYEKMPALMLDCELYDGPDGERRCASVARYGAKHVTNSMRIIAFDTPSLHHADEPFATRLQAVATAVKTTQYTTLDLSVAIKIPSVDAMLSLLATIHARNGEGLMLRHPTAPYTAGRSPNLIKLKYTR